jgi:DNA-binding CsgD family transcriptional regulator
VSASVLTPTQLVVLRLIADGLSGDEIARRLHVTPATVKFHRHHVIDRLEAKHMPHAVAIAFRTGELSAGRESNRTRRLVEELHAEVAR